MNEELRASLDELKKLTLLSAKNVLCFDDVVLLTGLSKSHLYKLTCSHQIPHYKPNNRHIYFDRAELENWMKQNRIATTMETAQVATEYLITGRIK